MNLLYGIAIALCVIMMFIFYYPPYHTVEVAGRNWSVIESYPNRVEAAAMLSRLHTRIITLLRELKHRWLVDATDDQLMTIPRDHRRFARPDGFKIISTLLDNYNPDEFYENDPMYSKDTSYTVNKGDSMYICLRQKANPHLLENEDTIFFVMLHECAHIGNYNGWGHDDRYWSVFKFLLEEAVAVGVYTPVDYAAYPAQYCSISIYYQPLDDRNLAAIA
jgi:hypothetical protein